MDEAPARRQPRAIITDLGPLDDPAGVEPSRLGRPGFWLGASLALAVALGVAGFLMFPGRSPQEKAAIKSAVSRYAEMFNEPESRVYKYGEIQAKPLKGGAWEVRISRVIVPDKKGGYRIKSSFQVDQDGTTRYTGQQEGRGD